MGVASGCGCKEVYRFPHTVDTRLFGPRVSGCSDYLNCVSVFPINVHHCKMGASSCSVLCSLKRKRSVVSLETKVAILDHLKKGETQARLVSEYGIGNLQYSIYRKTKRKFVILPQR